MSGSTGSHAWTGTPQLICRLLLLVARTSKMDLEAGRNRVLVRFEVVAARPCAFAVALRVEDISSSSCVYLRRSSILSGGNGWAGLSGGTNGRYVFAREDEDPVPLAVEG